MKRLASLLAASALLLAVQGCACAPGFVGFDSRCHFINVPSGQPRMNKSAGSAPGRARHGALHA